VQASFPGNKGQSLHTSLADLGWSEAFAAQIGPEDAGLIPARLALLHRGRIDVLTEGGATELICPPNLPISTLAVGDWVLGDGARVVRRLDRHSLLQRRAAGTGTETQLIAANVDTMFIVTSCNADFNEGRLERYLVLAHAAGIEPVIVLTKADQADPAPYVTTARALSQDLAVVAVNAKDPQVASAFARWCSAGQTVVLLGSSGVGKSTLANALAGSDLATGDIRADDAKGRHTTTARFLLPIPQGGWLIDTPGVRELQLTDVAEGIEILFSDLAELATHCRFRDCKHDVEPGCAVQAAIAAGKIDPARLPRWRKLVAEEKANSDAMAMSKTRAAGKYTKKSAAKRRHS
jgi:ribosome biogenesis GTPase / thiamine phosphate phosphatase